MTFKNIFLKELRDSTDAVQGIAQARRWPCEPIILSIGPFEGPTEVQLNSWQKPSSL